MQTHTSNFILLKCQIMLFIIALLLSAQSLLAAVDDSRPEVKKIRVNDYDMAYVERGSGAPLILIHGSLSDYRTWLPLLEEFSDDNRVIAVSLRHFYPEQWDGNGGGLSLQQHTADMAKFIQALDVGPVNLLGHSRGGAVALFTASKYPELVNRLILADPSPLASILPRKKEIQAAVDSRKSRLQQVMGFYQRGDAEGGMKEFVSYIAGPKAWDKTSKTRQNSIRSNAWTLTSLLKDVETPFSCSNAGKLTVPVLMVTGERSASLYGYMNTALQNCLKDSTDATIADAGHLMFHANPTAFIFEVQDFISP